MNHRFALTLLLVFGCSVDHGGLGGPTDGDDGGRADAGEMDGTVPGDDGGFDGGADGRDTGVEDGGVPGPDSGADAGRIDAGPMDAGPDAPPFDGGMDAGTDAGPFDAGCMASRCEGDVYFHCEGGVETRQDCDFQCMDGADGLGCYDLDVTNLDTDLSDAPARPTAIQTFRDISWDTSDCSSLPGYWLTQDQGVGAPDICVLLFHSVTFAGSNVITGSNALMVVALDTLVVSDQLWADGEGVAGGPGGGGGGTRGMAAEGPHPGEGGVHVDTYADGGGGGGGFAGMGGDGGDGGHSMDDDAVGGMGGTDFGGMYRLVPLQGGSGGGLGGTGESAGFGGGGGGALQLVARNELRIDGQISVSGGAGAGGGDGTFDDGNIGAGGGGGSGGGLILECGGTLVIGGSGSARAAGAGGGGAASCLARGHGESGEEEETGGIAGGERGFECFGGDVFGANGGDGDQSGNGSNGSDNTDWGSNGGGGGGAGGIIVTTATDTMGSLGGTGDRRSADPVLYRVEP